MVKGPAHAFFGGRHATKGKAKRLSESETTLDPCACNVAMRYRQGCVSRLSAAARATRDALSYEHQLRTARRRVSRPDQLALRSEGGPRCPVTDRYWCRYRSGTGTGTGVAPVTVQAYSVLYFREQREGARSRPRPGPETLSRDDQEQAAWGLTPYALLLVVYVEEMHGPPSHTRVRFAARLRARSVCTDRDTSRPTVCLCPVWALAGSPTPRGLYSIRCPRTAVSDF